MELGRLVMSLALASAACACSILIDRDRFEDGAAGNVAGGPAVGGAAGTGGGGAGGQGGAPDPELRCLNAQFHAGFDPPNEAFRGFLEAIGSNAGSVITGPAGDIRHGTGAFKIALAEDQEYTQLRSYAVDQEDVSYWVGFSQRIENLDMLTNGTSTFSIECVVPAPDYVRVLFGLEMKPGTPGSPYRSSGTGILDPEGSGRGFDHLDQIPGDESYSDWAIHMKLSETDEGYFDVYHAGTKVFSAPGRNVPDPAVETCNGFHMRFGLYRWDGFGDGGADAAPYPQTAFLDELVLLKVDESAELDARALFTLDPDSSCFGSP